MKVIISSKTFISFMTVVMQEAERAGSFCYDAIAGILHSLGLWGLLACCYCTSAHYKLISDEVSLTIVWLNSMNNEVLQLSSYAHIRLRVLLQRDEILLCIQKATSTAKATVLRVLPFFLFYLNFFFHFKCQPQFTLRLFFPLLPRQTFPPLKPLSTLQKR